MMPRIAVIPATMSMLAIMILTAAPTGLDNDPRWIPFTLTPANQILFVARIDGRPVDAVLDTGVTTSTVSRRFAHVAGFDEAAGPGADTPGGRVASGWTGGHAITLGALVDRRDRLAVATWPDAATGGARVDLLLGADATARYALDIDYEARRFRLLPSGRLPFRGSIIPLRTGGTWPFYRTEITIAGRRIDRIAVDTGDGTDIVLSQATAATLPPPPGPVTTTLDYAASGAMVSDLTILPVIRYGGRVLHDVTLRIPPARGFSQATGLRGRIGSGLLRRYRVLLDPRAGRIVLSPQADSARAPRRSTSGLLLAAHANRLDILHVMRGSPAERAGWHAGDTICAVDGAPVTPADRAPDWTIAPAGRVVDLRGCDGAIRPVRLARFY